MLKKSNVKLPLAFVGSRKAMNTLPVPAAGSVKPSACFIATVKSPAEAVTSNPRF